MTVRRDIVDLMEKNLTKDRLEVKGYIWEDRTFHSFGVSACNRDAWQTARAVAREPGGKINPLVICGGCGDGKTHLMNAIGLHLCRRGLTGVRWLSLYSLQWDSKQQLLNGKNLRCLLVDCVDAFKLLPESDRKAFLDVLDSIMAGGGQIVMTATVLPPALGEALSSWQGARVVTIAPPDGELRARLARRWLKQRKLPANEEMVAFFVETFTHCVRILEGAIVRLAAWSELEKRQPSLDMAKRFLHSMFPAKSSKEKE